MTDLLSLETMRNDVQNWREKAAKSESQKNNWLMFSLFMGLFLIFQFYYWAITPDKYWEVDPDQPVISFHYQLWSDRKDTRYRWGKNDDGDLAWITVDEKGRPTGGEMLNNDDLNP